MSSVILSNFYIHHGVKFKMAISPLLKFLVVLTLSVGSITSSNISPRLQSKFRQGPTTNVILTFATGTDGVLDFIAEQQYPDRTTLLFALATALDLNSAQSQSAVRNFLSTTNFTSDPLWVTDQLWIKDATEELVAQLLQSYPEIVEIFEDELTLLSDPPTDATIVHGRPVQPLAEWGVDKVRAPEAIVLLRNVTSNVFPTIRVATIDTGVRYTHEALLPTYLGEYGWFDPGSRSELPNDQNGHGTHVTGTIAGVGDIGVFSEAKWMACKGCATSMCSMYDLIRCGQWVLCPTRADGTGRDCSKAPHVVSNSWAVAYLPETTWFDNVVRAWRAGNIIPVFGIGNDGPNCGSVGYPGSLPDVIGVGATTTTDSITSFSSVGPDVHGRMKPDVVAPGANIVSTWNTADNAYRSASGTSMACPHGAGVVAILLAYNETMKYDQVAEALFMGADTNLMTSGRVCDGVIDSDFPNHVFGHGRLDAWASLFGLIGKVG